MSEKSVFAPLVKLTPRAFTETAYQVSILLRHRRTLTSTNTNRMLESVRVNGIVKTSSALKHNLKESVRRIEEAEGKSLAQIPDKEILKYQQELSGLVVQRARQASGPIRTSGELTLERLREIDPSKGYYVVGHNLPSDRQSSFEPHSAKRTPVSARFAGSHATKKSSVKGEAMKAVASKKRSTKVSPAAKATSTRSKSVPAAKGGVPKSRSIAMRRASA